MAIGGAAGTALGPPRTTLERTDRPCYRNLLRLPPLPRRQGSMAPLIEVEAGLLEAAAERLEAMAGC
jgi:hypothetical protein